MKSIQFLGACGMVTGSCYLLTGDKGEKILIDLGMFQEKEELGELNYEPFVFDPASIEGVLVTHAHLDHSGRLPLLVKRGYKGKIYMTKATRMLTALVLADSAKIAEEDFLNSDRHPAEQNKEKQILYTSEDVDNLLTKIEVVEYDKVFSIGSFDIVLRDAGHILGSGSIEVSGSNKQRIVFSGDLGNTPEDIVQPTEKIEKADFVVMESTYGDRIHRQEDPSFVLQEEINEVEKNGGVLLIPSFSIERAQELLHRINHLKNDKRIAEDTKVFLDSPMAIKATEIFRRCPELYNHELKKEINTDDPFNFPGLFFTESARESRVILYSTGPKVIISGSGMMHGGRVLHHAINYLSDPNTRLLLVGYQAPGTLGHQLLNGEKSVMIYNREIKIRANIRDIEAMSCHADQNKLLKWLESIRGARKVFLTHGEDVVREVLRDKIRRNVGIQEVVIPVLNETVKL